MADKPSVTAAVVASTLLLTRDDAELGSLVDRNATEAIEAAVRATIPAFGLLLDKLPRPILARAASTVERVISPGFVTHYALRKHAVREETRRATLAGARQVVLVGAGLDMLAMSVPEGVPVFEVDHPATQARRRAAVGARSRAVTFVSVDLARESLRDGLLAAPGFDASASTVYVAEGLLMYLAQGRVSALLADMACGPARTCAILTIVTPDRSGHVRLHSQRRIVDWCMRWLDEPFVWGERRENLAALLEPHGLVIDRVVSTTELRDTLLSSAARQRMPRSTGELIVVASTPCRGTA